MAEGSGAARSKKVAADDGMDRLGQLTDDLLQHVMSFLSSMDAVETCVLARRWRDLWKSVPALCITEADARRFWRATDLNRFVNYFLVLRGSAPLHEVEINTFEEEQGDSDFDETVQYLEVWVRHSLSHHVHNLCVSSNGVADRWQMPRGLINSSHLRVLELTRVQSDHDLDFSSCGALEELKMEFCSVYGGMIRSRSLRHLSISTSAFSDNSRIRICTPDLVCLLLVDCSGRTPLLERMPLLVSAFVRLQHDADHCKNSSELGDCEDDSCRGCRGSNYGKKTSVLLEGLSGATNLELIAAPTAFIFRKDLTHCPVFSKLKTLLLDEWFMTANLGALICFLQNSPVLEKLTLQFAQVHESLVETGASYDLRKQPLVLKHLAVDVKCNPVDEQIRKILDLLVSYGLAPERIKIQPLTVSRSGFQFMDTWFSGSFSFEQK